MTSTHYRAVFTDGREIPFDVTEVPFEGEPTLHAVNILDRRVALGMSPEAAASDAAETLRRGLSANGIHGVGLREIVPSGQSSRAEMAAEIARLRTIVDRSPVPTYTEECVITSEWKGARMRQGEGDLMDRATTEALAQIAALADRLVALTARVEALEATVTALAKAPLDGLALDPDDPLNDALKLARWEMNQP